MKRTAGDTKNEAVLMNERALLHKLYTKEKQLRHKHDKLIKRSDNDRNKLEWGEKQVKKLVHRTLMKHQTFNIFSLRHRTLTYIRKHEMHSYVPRVRCSSPALHFILNK